MMNAIKFCQLHILEIVVDTVFLKLGKGTKNLSMFVYSYFCYSNFKKYLYFYLFFCWLFK